jgi:hypothetical protein
MEKAQVVKRQQHFQEQFAVLDAELRALHTPQPADTQLDIPTKWRAVARRGLELQYELGALCAKHGECQLAVLCFQRVVDELKQLPSAKVGVRDESGPTDGEAEDQQHHAELVALHINVLNCLAALQFRQSDQAKAMALLLEAKQLHREAVATATTIEGNTNQTTESLGLDLMDKTLAVNYALFLHAKGSIQDAIVLARSVIEEPSTGLSDTKAQAEGILLDSQQNVAVTDADAAARSTAYLRMSKLSFQRPIWVFVHTNRLANSV